MSDSLDLRGKWSGLLQFLLIFLGVAATTTQQVAHYVHHEGTTDLDTPEPVSIHNASARYPHVFLHKGVDSQSRLAATAFALPEDLMRASIGNLGDSARMRHFVKTLTQSDEVVRVTILGGSIAQGCCIPGENMYLMSSPATFANRLFDWMRTVFPRPKHIFRNKAFSGMLTAYVNACFEEFLDPADKPVAELVIMDFASQEKHFASYHNRTEGRAEYEMLLRSILALPSKAAIIMLHWYTAPYVEPFLLSPEARYDELARYYEVPSLSWRAVEWRMAREPVLRLPQVYADYLHPTRAGHRYIFDMLAATIRDEALMFETLGKAQDSLTASLDLPPVLFPEANVNGERYCAVRDSLRPLLVSSEGWAWVNEPSKGGLSRTGYISTIVGSTITFRLPKREGNATKAPGYAAASLGVGHLKTYRNMGTFSVICTAGCSCGANEQDAHWDNKLSIIQWDYLPLTVTDYDACLVGVRVNGATSSGRHKVKIDSLLFSEKRRSDMCAGCGVEPHILVQ